MLRRPEIEEPKADSEYFKQLLSSHFPDDYREWEIQVKKDQRLLAGCELIYGLARDRDYWGRSDREILLLTLFKEGKSLEGLIEAKLKRVELLQIFDDSPWHRNLLDWACQKNHQFILDWCYNYLVLPFYKSSAKLDLKKRDESGFTLLHWAMCCKQNKETIAHLLQEGADINAPCLVEDLGVLFKERGSPVHLYTSAWTALHCAAKNGDLEGVKQLAEHKDIQLNALTANKETALLLALRFGRNNIIHYLSAQWPLVNEYFINLANPLGSLNFPAPLHFGPALAERAMAFIRMTVNQWRLATQSSTELPLYPINAYLSQADKFRKTLLPFKEIISVHMIIEGTVNQSIETQRLSLYRIHCLITNPQQKFHLSPDFIQAINQARENLIRSLFPAGPAKISASPFPS